MTTTSVPSKPASLRHKNSPNHRAFLGQFVGRPTMIGAVAPSSRHLAARVLEGLDLEHAKAVLEFGPGTGAITGRLVARLGANTKFVAIELNPVMAASFRKRFPQVKLREESVENARRVCQEEGIDSVDFIVCGLPWSSFSDDLQDRLLDATLDVLKPGGTLVSFAYHVGTWLPGGRRIRRKLDSRFTTVRKSRSVWRNLPPAFVYRCVK